MNAQLDAEFRDFMRARWPVMVRLAYGLTGDQGHAEDVAQTAFARAYASWPKVRRTDNPEAYVRRIVVNENRNRYRKHRVAERLTDLPPESAAAADATRQVQYGAVRADVTYVTVRLGNGTVLTLHPVTVYGIRAVAFAAPEDLPIAAVTAFSRGGQIATAVPFRYSLGPAYFGVWLRPGEHGNPRASYPVGTGTYLGQAWSATAHTGPWGTCLTAGSGGPGGAGCAGASAPGTGILFTTGGVRAVACGIAAPPVVRVVVRRPDSSSVQVRPVTVGGQKFFAFAMVLSGRHALSWTAYDSSGAVVASGGLGSG